MPQTEPTSPDSSSFGNRLFLRMEQHRAASGGKITREEWVRLANQEYAIASKHAKKKPAANPSKLPDEEWIKFLEAQSCYEGIDVRREIGKCQIWATGARKVASRQRIINWLNKSERPLKYDGAGKSSRPRTDVDPYKEPKWNWRQTAAALWPGWSESPYAAQIWGNVPLDYRSKILARGSIEPGQGQF